MRTIAIIFLAIFGVWSIMHLVFCFIENEKLRKLSKPVCLLLLGLSAVFFAPDYPLIYIGAFLGAIGDLILINKKNLVFFLSGTAIFITGHFCYFAQLMTYLSNYILIPWWVYLIIFGVLLVLTFALYPIDKKLAGPATLAGNFYMPFLLILLASGILFSVLANNNPDKGITFLPGLLVAVGYLFFFASDCTLVYTTFVKDIRRRDFPIMLTYLLGEFGIVFGLILTII